jgi:hypothetical protein
MKRLIFPLTAAVALFVAMTAAYADDEAPVARGPIAAFVDADGDGINDNAPDHDGDGINDNALDDDKGGVINCLDEDYTAPATPQGLRRGGRSGRRNR